MNTVLVLSKKEKGYNSLQALWCKLTLSEIRSNLYWDNGFLILEIKSNLVEKSKSIIDKRSFNIEGSFKSTSEASDWCDKYWKTKTLITC